MFASHIFAHNSDKNSSLQNLLFDSRLLYRRTLGLVEPTLLTDYAYQIGSIVHLLIMSLAITGRYNTMKREKLVAQIALTHSLESKVQERTASLVNEVARRETLEGELRRSLVVEQQARTEQRDFMALVSHEFRTPLAIINASVHHVAQSLNAAQGKSLERCSNIKESARRMTDLMDDYLSLERLEGDLQTLRTQTCNAQELVTAVAAEWPAGQVTLTLDQQKLTMQCDPRLLQVALRNLVANGQRHSPAASPVQLSVQGQPDGSVTFSVRDAGSGIAADELAHLFQKFFRGRSAQGSPGAGLGLYLVDRIALLHGGKVRVESQLGHGSLFTLTLPHRSEGADGPQGTNHGFPPAVAALAKADAIQHASCKFSRAATG